MDFVWSTKAARRWVTFNPLMMQEIRGQLWSCLTPHLEIRGLLSAVVSQDTNTRTGGVAGLFNWKHLSEAICYYCSAQVSRQRGSFSSQHEEYNRQMLFLPLNESLYGNSGAKHLTFVAWFSIESYPGFSEPSCTGICLSRRRPHTPFKTHITALTSCTKICDNVCDLCLPKTISIVTAEPIQYYTFIKYVFTSLQRTDSCFAALFNFTAFGSLKRGTSLETSLSHEHEI